MGVIGLILGFLRVVLLRRAALVAKNLALRQQLAALQVSATRPRLRMRDRVFPVWRFHCPSVWRHSESRIAATLGQPEAADARRSASYDHAKTPRRESHRLKGA